MGNGKRLLAKAIDSKVVSLILIMAVVFSSCRGITAHAPPAVFDITKFGAVGDGAADTCKVIKIS